jgi:hypothetical protein
LLKGFVSRNEVGEIPCIATVAEPSKILSEISNNRKGRSGRKQKADDALPSNKLKTNCHGCQGFLAYQDICKL